MKQVDERLAVVIMAAGKGTRMNDPSRAKVMYTINGRPMVDYVVELALRLGSSRTMVIVGWQKEAVVDHLHRFGREVEWVEQSPQLGTGHAVMQTEQPLQGFEGDVLVLSGDVPLLSYTTTEDLLRAHRAGGFAATVLTAIPDDPSGYGRILRNSSGHVVRIVEDKDSTPQERQTGEVNSGIYVFDKRLLFEALKHVTPSNTQKEYYLTDVFEYFRQTSKPVGAVQCHHFHEVLGINTPAQLEEVQRRMQAG